MQIATTLERDTVNHMREVEALALNSIYTKCVYIIWFIHTNTKT